MDQNVERDNDEDDSGEDNGRINDLVFPDVVPMPVNLVHADNLLGDIIDELYSGTSDSENSLDFVDLDEEAGGDGSERETAPYDQELTTTHRYMGKMESVSGMEYIDPGTKIRIYYTMHHSIIFPGELIPMMFTSSEERQADFGKSIIGLIFLKDGAKLYGVTCQVIEKSITRTTNSNYMSIRSKLRALQRVIVRSNVETNFYNPYVLPRFNDLPDSFIDVEVLPELSIGQPLTSGFHSSAKLNHNISIHDKLRRFLSHSRPWPQFVYSYYDVQRIMFKIKLFSSQLKNVYMPTDLVQCSFWSARNLPLDNEDHKQIFISNFVELRMLLIDKKLDSPYIYSCLHCHQKIANFSDVCPMTKEGVQANYCNMNGFIHETITIRHVEEDALAIENEASTRFSWFPGYSWRIAYCSQCSRHKGWQFTAVKKNLTPPFFFGLSRNSVTLTL